MSTINFDLLPQTNSVQALLNACIAVLPFTPEPERGVLITAIKEFESFGTPTAWSADDVNDDLGLTEEEKTEVISRFVECYDCKQSDWDTLDVLAQHVLAERN